MSQTDDPRPYWHVEEVERRERGDAELDSEMRARDKDLADRMSRGDARLQRGIDELKTELDHRVRPLEETSPGRRLDRIEARLEKLVYVMYIGLIGGPAATAGLLQLLELLGRT